MKSVGYPDYTDYFLPELKGLKWVLAPTAREVWVMFDGDQTEEWRVLQIYDENGVKHEDDITSPAITVTSKVNPTREKYTLAVKGGLAEFGTKRANTLELRGGDCSRPQLALGFHQV